MDKLNLLRLIEEESSAQRRRYQSNDNFKQLKRDGLLIHPIHVQKKSYGYLDYPEFSFKVPFQQNSQLFKSGSPVEIVTEKDRYKALLINFDGRSGECRIFKSDFPDELNDGSVGLQLAYDEHTNEVMTNALKHIETNKRTFNLFSKVYQDYTLPLSTTKEKDIVYKNQTLNDSQKSAIEALLPIQPIGVLHGPPGTGKTTTLVELVHQKLIKGQNILISAPSNAAIDHIGHQLIKNNIEFLRLGNNSKVDETIRPFTIEGKMEQSNMQQNLKKLRIQSEQYRKMATSYKRNFGKDERDQRKLLLQEVKNIRAHIQSIQQSFIEECMTKTRVLIGTPVSIYDAKLDYDSFDSLLIDEAAQCLDPLIWAIAPLAHQLVLIGDPFQLPPTVIAQNDLKITLLERLIASNDQVNLLDVQYRMPEKLIQFSNDQFYNGKLKTEWPTDIAYEFKFYDTAGSEAWEKEDEDTGSIFNEEEINYVQTLIEQKNLPVENTVIIAPYAAQVARLKQALPQYKSSTIDSIQGQEAENVILTLVRSNTMQNIGFLKDYRRMNVALTRSKRNFYIIGDSTTITKDLFFQEFITNIEKLESYESIYTLIYQ